MRACPLCFAPLCFAPCVLPRGACRLFRSAAVAAPRALLPAAATNPLLKIAGRRCRQAECRLGTVCPHTGPASLHQPRRARRRRGSGADDPVRKRTRRGSGRGRRGGRKRRGNRLPVWPRRLHRPLKPRATRSARFRTGGSGNGRPAPGPRPAEPACRPGSSSSSGNSRGRAAIAGAGAHDRIAARARVAASCARYGRNGRRSPALWPALARHAGAPARTMTAFSGSTTVMAMVLAGNAGLAGNGPADTVKGLAAAQRPIALTACGPARQAVVPSAVGTDRARAPALQAFTAGRVKARTPGADSHRSPVSRPDTARRAHRAGRADSDCPAR